MKKTSLIIWILATVLVFSALIAVYNRSVKERNDTGAKNESVDEPRDIDEEKLLKQMPQEIIAPDFELKDLSGKAVKLSDYKGKTVFINFWATWCPYCVEEMPDLDKAREYLVKQGNAELLTINIQESKEQVQEYIREKKLKLPVLLDTEGSVTNLYLAPFGINGIPVTFIINPGGTIYNIIGGATDKDTILDYAEYISKSRESENKP